MDITKYPASEQLSRAAKTLRVLAGHTVYGLTPGEIAKAVDEGVQSNITRTLAHLSHVGFVEETKTPGRWRLGPMLIRIALAHQSEMAEAERLLEEIKQRCSRKV